MIGTIAVLLDFLATIQIELALLVVGLWGCSPRQSAIARSMDSLAGARVL